MAADWQRWYQHEIDKWQGSATVQTFSDAAYRAFHNLIMAQFQQDDGKLPSDPTQLSKLSRMGTRWLKVAGEVLAEFEIDEYGRIFNSTQYKTWQAAHVRHIAYLNRPKKRKGGVIDDVSIDDQYNIDTSSLEDSQLIDNTKEKKKEKKDKDSCTEASSVPPFTTLPLVSGEEFPISFEQFAGWEKAFPGVEVENQLQRLRVWLQANPRKGSTRKGILKRAVNWLSTAQDRSHGGIYGAGASSGNRNQQRTNGNLEAARSAASTISAEILDWPSGSAASQRERGDVEAVLIET